MSTYTVRGARLAALLLPLVLSAPALAQLQATRPQWSTYVGGSESESFYAVVQDPTTEDIVAVGASGSANLAPVSRPAAVPVDALVSIFSKGGALRPLAGPRHVIFGGTDFDQITAVAIGGQRQLYVVGRTRSPAMVGFPTGAVYRTAGGDFDGFLAELGPDGEPRWFMYLGGVGSDAVLGIATVGTRLYITGYTNSGLTVNKPGPSYPTPEAFVASLDATTTPPTFTWSQILTGVERDELSGITSDAEGNLYVTGTLTSNQPSQVPATNSFLGGDSDGVVLKLTPSGSIVWLTYVGGPAKDTGQGIVLGSNGEVVAVGSSESPGNSSNALVVRVNSAGLEQERRELGRANDDLATSVAMDAGGNLYVAGSVGSAGLSVRGGFDPTFAGSQEGFVAMLPAKGGPGWSSYLGGSEEEQVNGLSISAQGRLMLVGLIQSSTGLPGQGGYDTTFGGGGDGFIVAVDPDTTPPVEGRVFDRPAADEVHEDVSQGASLTSLSANWEGFSDDESQVAEYEWAIGTAASPESIQPFTSVAAARSATATDLKLEGGTDYVITVRATNGAGLIATARSNGVKVTVSPTGPLEDEPNPVGWACSATAGTGLPLLLSVLALALRRRRV